MTDVERHGVDVHARVVPTLVLDLGTFGTLSLVPGPGWVDDDHPDLEALTSLTAAFRSLTEVGRAARPWGRLVSAFLAEVLVIVNLSSVFQTDRGEAYVAAAVDNLRALRETMEEDLP